VIAPSRAMLTLVCAATVSPAPALGQSTRGGFIARLGTDTVHIERFERAGNTFTGTILQRTPAFRRIHWTLTVDAAGKPARYEAKAADAAGNPFLNGATGTMEFGRDSIVRTTYRNGQAETQSLFAPEGAVPSPSLPYVGVSYLSYELGFDALRKRLASGGGTDTSLYQLTLLAGQRAPGKTRAWVVSPDSAELSYFGVAKSGYRFDRDGRLIRSDWTGTTYRYRVERLADVDLDPIARAWSDAEQRQRGFGALSPRDSSKATVGAATLTIDYSRPSVRGRRIWGDVVPWDTVWRLGADVATHFTTDVDLAIGGAAVPAGRYTLWMLPSETTPQLIVSRLVNVFGTNYNPAQDLVRVPLTRRTTTELAERLTLDVRDGALNVRWADVVWSVPVAVRN
jgi:hypothetical protein